MAVERRPTRREFYITLEGKRRADGTMFVTSPQLKPFSAIVSQGEDGWQLAIKMLGEYLEKNIDAKFKLRLIPEGEEALIKQAMEPKGRKARRTPTLQQIEQPSFLAAHVIAAVNSKAAVGI